MANFDFKSKTKTRLLEIVQIKLNSLPRWKIYSLQQTLKPRLLSQRRLLQARLQYLKRPKPL